MADLTSPVSTILWFKTWLRYWCHP